MKKTGAICFLVTLTCAALLLTACQKDGGDSGNDSSYSGLGKGGEDAADMGGAVPEKEWAYVPEFITVGDDRASYGDMQLLGDTVCYISMVSEVAEEAQKICRYSLADRELTQISIQWPIEEQNREICSFAFNPDYSVWLIVNAYSADYSQLNRYLCRFDSEGRNLAALDITQEMGRGSSVGDMAVDGQGRIYVFTSEHAEEGEAGVWLYTGDGDYQERLCFGVSETVRLIGTIEGDDGRFYACISKGESPDCCTMLEVDFEGKRLTEVDTEFPNVNGLCKGKQYDLLLYDDRFVYGYDFPAEGSGSGQMPEELFAWTDSDINGYFVEDLRTLGEDRYYATVENWINKDRSIVVLRRTKASDVVPRKNMVLAAVDGGGDLAALAIKFNRSQGQYHIDVADYDSLTDLYNAILTKEAVDIINLSGVDVESLSRQGIFEDLMPYLERSQDLAPSDFVEGLLDTYTVNGLLAGIPERFRLETLGGDRGLLEGEPGLTLERLFAIAERNPEALPVGEVTKEEVMRYLMMFNQDAFIDWETGECRFDSAQFREVLEFANRFPDTLETVPGEDSLPRKTHDGRVLFAIYNMGSLGAFQYFEGLFGETAAFVGFPTGDGKGGTLLYPRNAFGITAMSQCKEGAWEFIESILEPGQTERMEPEQVYREYSYYDDAFPSLKRSLDIIAEYAIEDDRIWAEEGHSFGGRIYDDGWFMEFHAVTREEIDAVLALVKDAKPFRSAEGDEIIKIIGEEAPAFYSGQKSLEDVAEVIQSRVRIYVNENM
ncbi:MAG: extracellular solute-binding protein [Lachnospiraceae bacterium]|jgi:ABC-type glycerol-3-phosphate transport system substrate-binding protein|nr:extracellular solute-binding protein [Lachnospiraceae bacterium]